MVLILLMFLLVAGVAFFQAVHGLFSAIIMAVLTILCAAVAFQFYEPVAQLLYTRQPAYADAVALLALFVIPLLVLRIGIDHLIPGNVMVGAWPDRIAGGAVGLVTGMVVVGVLAIVIQLLPTGPRWLMYRPFNDALQREQGLAPFYPDEFTLGLIDTLSAGSLKGDRKFSQAHDNLLLEAWCARNEANQVREVDNEKKQERIGRMDALPGSLTLVGVYEPNEPAWKSDVPLDPLMGETEPSRILIVRVGVDESARDTPGDWWRLPATHFRLAVKRSKQDSNMTNHYPVGFLTAYESSRGYGRDGKVARGTLLSWKVIAAPRENNQTLVGRLTIERPWLSDGGPKRLTIDWIFRIGRDEEPDYVAFRRVAKQEFPKAFKPGMPDPKDALDRVIKITG